MITREAGIGDWEQLHIFFKKIYREGHPLHVREFWEWQFGDSEFGRSFISINEHGNVTGHVGASFGGGVAWIINVYLDESCRGQGILGRLYALARQYFPLAATAANEAGLGLYRNMRWIRYHDLLRYVKISPYVRESGIEHVCRPVYPVIDEMRYFGTHYFKQPGIKGIIFKDGSKGVDQSACGGLRVTDIENLPLLEEEAWKLGYKWLDYITSWNDLKIKNIESAGWVIDTKSVVPWWLNPIVPDRFCDITFLSEAPLDNDFVVHRSFSDHGRIGSL